MSAASLPVWIPCWAWLGWLQVRQHHRLPQHRVVHRRRQGRAALPRPAHRAARGALQLPRGASAFDGGGRGWGSLGGGGESREWRRLDLLRPTHAPALQHFAYLVVYGNLPTAEQSSRWSEAVMRHSALPVAVEQTIAALPHDAHPMGTILTGLCALSTLHPEQNPALAGQNIYASKEVQDKQVVRLIGKIPTLAALAYHRASGRKPAQPNQNLGYAEVRVWSCVCDGVRWRWRCCPEFLLLIVSVSVFCCCPCH